MSKKFKNGNMKLLKEFATRQKLDLYYQLFSALPDPDTILAENNYDYNIYRDLLTDPHLMSTIQQRKMQVLQMELEVNHTDEKLKSKAIELINNLPLSKVMGEILDCVFFGMSIGEIEWKKINDEFVPVDVVSKPQEWFIFNRDNELRLRKRINGSYLFEEGEKLPDFKFIVSRYHPTYTNPYGEKILSRCYWAVTFKRSGVEFWQVMMEKFGMPYLIGRYPPSETEPEKDTLLENLELMIENQTAVFPDSTVIEIKESPQYDIGQLYENLAKFHNNEVSKAVLTVTLTTEIQNVGSYKAAEIHREMLEYLGITDKKIVENALNVLLEYYCYLNYGMTDAPKVVLRKKENVIEHSTERDKALSEIGVRFTKEYFVKRYNLEENEFVMGQTSDVKGQTGN